MKPYSNIPWGFLWGSPTGENLIPIPMGMRIPMGIPILTATLEKGREAAVNCVAWWLTRTNKGREATETEGLVIIIIQFSSFSLFVQFVQFIQLPFRRPLAFVQFVQRESLKSPAFSSFSLKCVRLENILLGPF